ncbi:DNA methyltransferase [Nodosilinea sp. P-1105]|uniref:Eco57I restriction-modification methylase domain-containing protein n=1 Tax=Nodosilinea sp. P-1105 TaxID=2546229 RepID=UPI00197EF4F2
MLFAKFLAENHLLMHPEGVAVSLQECEELAAEEGIDAWTLASRYAASMLPQIFRPDDPLLQLTFALEHKQALEKLLAELSSEVFTASDSLGWVYQFWQAKRKEEVNKSGNKIGADELPAVTQLFTEDYMVDFLLQNTLGAWWVGHHPTEPLPLEMPYLRFVETTPTPSNTSPTSPTHPPIHPSTHPPSHPTPASGTFPGWPKTAKELRILDPCCGSGHFLVAEFNLLVPMRMQEEGLSAQAACDAVLRENLYGLEIDERCTQIAAFALAMAAWTYPEAGGYRQLPKLNIACSGIAISAKREDWLALAGDDSRLRRGMSRLYFLFEGASTYGSLINPADQSDQPLLEATYTELLPILEQALVAERNKKNYWNEELGVAAQGIATAAKFLSTKYHLVATNVPFLYRGKQSEKLKNFCDAKHSEAKSDLSTVFVDRCLDFLYPDGSIALVTPQDWVFKPTYKDFRKFLLKEKEWKLVSFLGPAAFQDMNWWAAKTQLFVITNRQVSKEAVIHGIDITENRVTAEKPCLLKRESLAKVSQHGQLKNPDFRIILEAHERGIPLKRYAKTYQGIKTGDDPRFRRFFWELPFLDERWRYLQSTVEESVFYGGLESIVDWVDDGESIARLQGLSAWEKPGVAISQMRHLPCAIYFGEIFDSNTSPIIPDNPDHLPALWAFCRSEDFYDLIRQIDPALKVANSSFTKISFDLEHWQKVAQEEFPNGLPEPYSKDPTQWIFKGSVSSSTDPLQVAIARLLNFSWHKQADDDLDQLIDDDGIVCIPSIRGEQPASERLRNLLVKAYGKGWTSTKLRELLDPDGYGDKGLDDWLRNYFFEKHCKVFQSRPFIWHIWDGLKDGFAALVNYHKLDYKCLETLAYTYLGDWIREQQAAVKAGTSGADNKLLKAKQLQDKLALILASEKPYDIFVRWKPLEQQPIGWHPDLNDGVRLNIRPFMKAGVLRKNPNIKWNKDRGKNPPDSPWGEERLNDIHLTLEEKRQAQEATQP